MQQHGSKYFARRHTIDTGWGQNVKTFFSLKVVLLHIKLKGIGHRASCKHIFYPYTHPRSVGLGQKAKLFVLIVVMLHIKLKGKKYRPVIQAKTLTLHTPLTSDLG